jgi:tRNA-(ms[2]io[6]A)-hydroxylase
MLNLASTTSPDWIERVLDDFDAVLLDHAHCEKKAAGAAVKLLFQYPDHRFLLQPVAALAREELDHFQQVLERLEKRGLAFERQRPSPYGGRLHGRVRREEPGRLLDRLLVSALIEARSCERFQVLAERHPDPVLADFYAGLLASEARHHGIYLQLAEHVAPGPEVRTRLAELAEAEAAILREDCTDARLHS